MARYTGLTAEVERRFHFEYAHFLPEYKGRCAFTHGHSGVAYITLRGLIGEQGMVMDFTELKKLWNRHFDSILDHQMLNESLPLVHPTAEQIACWIMETLIKILPNGISPVVVKVYETRDASASVRYEDMIEFS